MRKRLFEIIQISKPGDRGSIIYDYIIIINIVVSLIPLAFKGSNLAFEIIDKVTVTVFILDYVLREAMADLKMKKGMLSFFIYPFTLWALIDLLSILPSFKIVSSSFKMLKLLKLLRMFRVFQMFRNARSLHIILDVLKIQRFLLLSVGAMAIGYIITSALVIFNVEPDTFPSLFDAIYWATVSLTAIGYGDIYPVTATGRIVTMVSSLLGIAIVALPTGILTAGFIREFAKENKAQAEE